MQSVSANCSKRQQSWAAETTPPMTPMAQASLFCASFAEKYLNRAVFGGDSLLGYVVLLLLFEFVCHGHQEG